MDIELRNGETVEEYKFRLSKNRKEYDLTWSNIAKLVNDISENKVTGESCRSSWRRRKKENIDYDDMETFEKKKEKVKISDKNRAYNNIVRKEARRESLLDIVRSEVKSIEPCELEYEKYNSNVGLSPNNDLLISLNDIHYGANIDNYWNVYNPYIAEKRMTEYLVEIVRIKNLHNSTNCYVCANGDLISGKIHHTLEISNCLNIVKQVKGVSELISVFLSKLCGIFQNVYFSVVAGNHSRMGKKEDSPKDERLDDLIPWYVEARMSKFRNFEILSNDIDSTLNLIDIRGKNYVNVHGNYDKFPSILKLVSMLDKEIYAIHFGHLHHNATDYNQKYKLLMSGSFQGIDDFCIENRIFGHAQQLVSVCGKNGVICTYDIDLQ